MFDDFDLYQQIDEITPEEDYENLIALLLETSRAFTEEEQKLYWKQLNKNSISTNINFFDLL